jgi:hypothetical protein
VSPEKLDPNGPLYATLKFCACCPAPCRSAIPPSDESYGEIQIPSSLALIALALLEGELPLDKRVEQTLRDTSATRHAVRSCAYGYDVVDLIESLLEGPLRSRSPQEQVVSRHE